MNLAEFKQAVDRELPASRQRFREKDATDSRSRSALEQKLMSEIRSHFPASGALEVPGMVRELRFGLALRSLCDAQALQPYFNVAQALNQAVITNGTSQAREADWFGAVRCALDFHLHFPPGQGEADDLLLRSNARAQMVSKSVLGLRALGYSVTLPNVGGVDFDESNCIRLQGEIHALATRLGGQAVVASALGAMESSYSARTDRFNLGRRGQTITLDAKPQRPLAYLYQLGLRYFSCEPACDVAEPEFGRLVDLLTYAVGLLDLERGGPLGMLFARPHDILESMRGSLLYDANFCLTQAAPKHVQTFVQWLLRDPEFAHLRDDRARSAAQVLAAAEVLLHDTGVGPIGLNLVPTEALADHGRMNRTAAAELMREVFAHEPGALNPELTFPLDDTKVNSAFRPLLTLADGRLLRLPRNLSARAVLNAVTDWCRRVWPSGKSFDEALGLAIERFVRSRFEVLGIAVCFGSYGPSECDLVVQTDTHIVFLELKGKVLTRQSRTGDVFNALQDLAVSMVHPQAQAMERHAYLRENQRMTLDSSHGPCLIELGTREVLKVSITRGELLSLHDRAFLKHLLKAGCQLRFDVVTPKQQKKLDHLHEQFDWFKSAAKRAGELNLGSSDAFSNCWSLSLFQLLLLLERTGTASDFVRELLRTQRLTTPTRDFYTEYEFKLMLDSHA